MNDFFVKDKLPETNRVIICEQYGLHKDSHQILIATKNGGFYLGHLELTKFRKEYSELKGWIPCWYLTSIGDDDIDCDGTEIFNVVAWMEIPKLRYL